LSEGKPARIDISEYELGGVRCPQCDSKLQDPKGDFLLIREALEMVEREPIKKEGYVQCPVCGLLYFTLEIK